VRALPIRLKLTCWYFLMFATAGLLLSLTSWWMLRHTLDATIQQDLQERVDDVRMQFHQMGPAASVSSAQARFDAVYRYRDDGKWLQILDQNGSVIYRSTRMATLRPAPVLNRQLPAKGLLVDLTSGTHSVRLLTSKISTDGRQYFVQTGISMSKPHVLLNNFGLGLLLLTPGMLLLAAAGGHFMSRKALSPVALIAHEVRRITDRNLHQRLPVSPSNDELSHLSITLNGMLARIDTSFRSVRDFTANASHELRTPLARLRTEVEVALMSPRSIDEYRLALERLHQDAIDMSGLVENLLTLARAEAGNDILELTPIDLRPLLLGVVREWTPMAKRLSLHLRTAGFNPQASDEPLLILGERQTTLRLLRILLDNACKFTPPGGTITIRTTPGPDKIMLAVEDTGIGIAPEYHSRIFERFYRVHGDADRQAPGAGLGLSLAAWIAEQHRTRIILDSTPGKGSRFQISFTRVEDDETARQFVLARGIVPAPVESQLHK
jgi:signal transduction histidine kinase